MVKKLFYISVIIIVFVSLLSSCNRSITYPFAQHSDAIVKIEIIEISDYRIISTGNFDMITIQKTIGLSQHSTFLTMFEKLPCYKSRGPSQECLEGKAIRFTYSDGAFEIVGAETSFYCTQNKDWSYFAYYFDYTEFYSFLSEIV